MSEPTTRKLWRSALDLVYPPSCPVCERPLPRGTSPSAICSPCAKDCKPIVPPFCQCCGEPYPGAIKGRFTCTNCRDQSFAFDFAIAGYLNEGPVRQLVHGLKYRRRQPLRRPLARLAGRALADPRFEDWSPALVPVPLYPARERERGFNQAREIALSLAREHRLPIANLLRRTHPTGHQALLGRSQRQKNLQEAFTFRGPIQHEDLIIVDDVLTTGSTAHACAQILREAGAHRIAILTVARG